MLCGVCQVDRPGTMNRMGGLDVCDVCARGAASESVKARGWTLNAESFVRYTRDHTWYYVRVEGTIDDPLAMTATFRMKEGYWFWLGMVWGIRVNDPLFNKLVLATSATKPLTRQFLESEGAQSALMDLVGEGGTIQVRGSSISVQVRQEGSAPDQARIEAETAVLMAHLETFAAVQAAS